MKRKWGEDVNCQNCGKEIQETDNFCSGCGMKLKKVCNCWLKKGNYDCGESSCPGYGLFRKLKAMEKQVKKMG